MEEGLVALTVTPGSTPPLLSATLPLIDPVVLAPPPCANACVDMSRQVASIATTKCNPRRFMTPSSFVTRSPVAAVRFWTSSALRIGKHRARPEARRLAAKLKACNDLHVLEDMTSGDMSAPDPRSGSLSSGVRIRRSADVGATIAVDYVLPWEAPRFDGGTRAGLAFLWSTRTAEGQHTAVRSTPAATLVGARVCATCHQDVHDGWKSGRHSKMIQPANAASVDGDFSRAESRFEASRFSCGSPTARISSPSRTSPARRANNGSNTRSAADASSTT